MAKTDLAEGLTTLDLREGHPVAGMFESEDVVLIRHEGRICAFARYCTHLGAPLEKGLIVDGELRCPWHHARFSLADGEAVGAPAFEPLTRFSVVEEDGMITVTGKIGTIVAPPRAPSVGRVVIVGGGAAGYACADMLARAGVGGDVTLLSADPNGPYDRTFCSKQYLAGKKSRDDTILPQPGLGRGPAPAVRTNTEIRSIDPDGKTVITDDGDRIPFDILVLATGATPVMPDIPGFEGDAVHMLRTLADADALIAAAGRATHAIVLGASFIGLEAAASLTQRGLAVTVVARDAVPLAKVAGPEVGGFVQQMHEKKGVTFRLEREIVRFEGNTATLDDGSMVAGDLLVVGVGVQPCTRLAEAAGITLADIDAGGGIAVDAQLCTSVPGIYAIGDVASYPDPRLNHSIRVEHWVHAQRQGQWLARHLLGKVDGGYAITPFFWSGHYEKSLRYVGHVANADDRRVEGEIDAADFAVMLCERGEEQAMLTCGRDILSLKKEAVWDQL